jgi:hypothetical protein
MKGISGHDWPELNIGIDLHGDRDTPKVSPPRSGCYSLSELTLHHQNGLVHSGSILNEVKDDIG